MKIAIIVHGRFHAFSLAKALIERGNEVTLFTDYPKWAVTHWGIAPEHVRSFWPHGVALKIAAKVEEWTGIPYPEPVLHQWFGRWAAKALEGEHWDGIHCWSGVAEETLLNPKLLGSLRLLMRGSAHIATQARLLSEEQQRTGQPIEQPSAWIVAREEREYKLTDMVVCLSTFAYQSFLAEGADPARLSLIPLGVQLESFRPSRAVIDERCRRIREGKPLRVLYVGAISYRKGLWDLAEILRRVEPKRFDFRFVGPVLAEAKKAVAELRGLAQFTSKQKQQRLPPFYDAADLFLFPTIEDGFAAVLSQAQAAGLPILTTTNCGGPDILEDGKTGWILPIRDARAFIDKLNWCDTHREELCAMVERSYEQFHPRTWDNMAEHFEELVRSHKKT